MRTAVCITGLPREIDETWRPMYDNLISRMPNPDVFIYSGAPYPVGPDFFEIVKPKRYIVEPQQTFTEGERVVRKIGYYASHHVDSLLQQFYGLKRAFEVMADYEREAGFEYDFVVRTRTDLIFLRPVTLDLMDPARLNTLHAHFAPTMAVEFAAGPRSVMQKYCGVFDWLLTHGEAELGPRDPRLGITSDGLYNCDVIMTAYLIDRMGVERAEQRLPPEAPCPYLHYRIISRHKKGLY